MPGDFDGDSGITLKDYAEFRVALDHSGPGINAWAYRVEGVAQVRIYDSIRCSLDWDGDCDLADFAIMQRTLALSHHCNACAELFREINDGR